VRCRLLLLPPLLPPLLLLRLLPAGLCWRSPARPVPASAWPGGRTAQRASSAARLSPHRALRLWAALTPPPTPTLRLAALGAPAATAGVLASDTGLISASGFGEAGGPLWSATALVHYFLRDVTTLAGALLWLLVPLSLAAFSQLVSPAPCPCPALPLPLSCPALPWKRGRKGGGGRGARVTRGRRPSSPHTCPAPGPPSLPAGKERPQRAGPLPCPAARCRLTTPRPPRATPPPQLLAPAATAAASGVLEALDPASLYLRKLLGAGALLLAATAHSLAEAAQRTRELGTLAGVKLRLLERLQQQSPAAWLARVDAARFLPLVLGLAASMGVQGWALWQGQELGVEVNGDDVLWALQYWSAMVSVVLVPVLVRGLDWPSVGRLLFGVADWVARCIGGWVGFAFWNWEWLEGGRR
jgi:hypothetical protein